MCATALIGEAPSARTVNGNGLEGRSRINPVPRTNRADDWNNEHFTEHESNLYLSAQVAGVDGIYRLRPDDVITPVTMNSTIDSRGMSLV
jgi:hypothetical protein